MVIVLLTAGSLYVSSLCNSGLWALLISFPATLAPVMYLEVGMMRLRLTSRGESSRVLTLLLIAGFIAVVQRFALTNHRSAERGAGRVWKQVILMVAFVAAGVMIVAGSEFVRSVRL